MAKDNEFRFEVDWNEQVSIKLVDGKAEIFGTEMAQNTPYDYYGGSKLAIFTFHGCVLHVSGNCKSAYLAKETPMNSVLNLHLALENLRNNAQSESAQGPVVYHLYQSICFKCRL